MNGCDKAFQDKAVARVVAGERVPDVAEALKVSQVSIYNWLHAAGYKSVRWTKWVKA